MAATFKRATQMNMMAAATEQEQSGERGFSLRALLRPASGGSESRFVSFDAALSTAVVDDWKGTDDES
jgi:hypothetical protein